MIQATNNVFPQHETTACNLLSNPESSRMDGERVVQEFIDLAGWCVEAPVSTSKAQKLLFYAAVQIIADVQPKSIDAWATQESMGRIGLVLEQIAEASRYMREILQQYFEFMQTSVPKENTRFTEDDDHEIDDYDDDDGGPDEMTTAA